MIRARRKSNKREPTIALINIVFLMLVFFMVAGTLAQPLDEDVTLVNTADLEGRAPPDAVVVRMDGTLDYRGTQVIDIAAHLQTMPEEERKVLRLVPDRALPASELVRLANVARANGAERVLIVTQRGVKQ